MILKRYKKYKSMRIQPNVESPRVLLFLSLNLILAKVTKVSMPMISFLCNFVFVTPLQDLHCQMPSVLPCPPDLTASSWAFPMIRSDDYHNSLVSGIVRKSLIFSTSLAFIGLSFFGPYVKVWITLINFLCIIICKPCSSFFPSSS